MIEAYTSADLLQIAIRGGSFDPYRIMATYAARSNWTQLYSDQRCWWAWTGPVMPPFELAQRALQP